MKKQFGEVDEAFTLANGLCATADWAMQLHCSSLVLRLTDAQKQFVTSVGWDDQSVRECSVDLQQ